MVYERVEEIRVDTSFERKLPSPGDREFEGLLSDIKERGVLVDLLVTRDGLLLDGHRRLRAAREAGLRRVPVKRLAVEGERSCEKAIAIAVNVFRRHLGEAQRANLGSSLLRLERKKSKERLRDAGRRGGKLGGRGRPKALGSDAPRPTPSPDRATERVAQAVGISRKTLERVEAVKKDSPELAKRMLDGKISVSSAYKKLKVDRIRKESEAERQTGGRVKNLESVRGRYRTVYLDPPWQYRDSGVRGAAEGHYPTMSEEELSKLPVPALAHPRGAHFWLWTTWPLLREGLPHRLLSAWGIEWLGEIIWDKQILGTGNWVRGRTEVLVLAGTKHLPLLSDCVDPLVSVRRGRHSEKPGEFRELLESLSPGPRIELFARSARAGWSRWGIEA